MDSSGLSLPIPFLTALVAVAVVVRLASSTAIPKGARVCFALLFAIFALQAMLVGMRFGYRLDFVAPYQRVLPFAAGPLTYLGFRAMAARRIGWPGLWHGAAALLLAGLSSGLLLTSLSPAASTGMRAYGNLTVDLLIAASFAVYIVLLARLFRRGPDIFTSADFALAARTRQWLLAAIVFLAVIALVDILIALNFALFGGRQAVTMIGLVSLGVVAAFLVGLIFYPVLSRSSHSLPPAERNRPELSADEQRADSELLDALRALMVEKRLYRDPDLTLVRLGRRLGVPARRISEAVNRQLGLNVSQYVNEFRVDHAAELLAGTERPVADLMMEAGFRTKSNFNREFRRITGSSPAEHRGRAKDAVPR